MCSITSSSRLRRSSWLTAMPRLYLSRVARTLPGVRGRFASSAGALLAATLVAQMAAQLAKPAFAGRSEAKPKVLVATSGNRSETRRTIPITRKSGADRRVVMSMRPRNLPDPKAGDRLIASAEVMVTVDCLKRRRSCAGRPYLYNPRVGARLVLARGHDTAGGLRATPISGRKRITCRGKPPSSRQHHCVIVFKHASLSVHRLRALPCAPRHCRVNLVLDAHSGQADRGDKLVIGNNR